MSRPRPVAPHGGYGFGPRHLDIHKNGRWVYVSLERQNELALFDLHSGALSRKPRAVRPLLQGETAKGVTQKAGGVHVHPRGHIVYAANRSDRAATATATGEDSIVVFALDETGVPHPIQRVPTMGAHCRTFHIDPDGRFLAAAHIRGATTDEEPCISIFSANDDGRLTFIHRQMIKTNRNQLFWSGMPREARAHRQEK